MWLCPGAASHSPPGSSSPDWSGVLGRRPGRWFCVLSMAAASSLQHHSSHPPGWEHTKLEPLRAPLFSWAHYLVCISLSKRCLYPWGSCFILDLSSYPPLSLGVGAAGRAFLQLTCQARVSSSRLAASVPSGSINSSSASLLLVPRRPADTPVGQEGPAGKASLFPPHDTRPFRSEERKRGI